MFLASAFFHEVSALGISHFTSGQGWATHRNTNLSSPHTAVPSEHSSAYVPTMGIHSYDGSGEQL